MIPAFDLVRSAAIVAVVDGQATTSTTVAGDSFPTTGQKVWFVVGLLVALAIALTVLTVLYWKRTRPVRGSSDESTAEPTTEPSAGSNTPTAPVGPIEQSLAEALRPENP